MDTKVWFSLAMICTSLFSVARTSRAVEWYEGGNLQRASVAQWKTAGEHNRLATCADYYVKITKVQKPRLHQSLGALSREEFYDAIKPDCERLEHCISKSVTTFRDTDNAAHVAYSCYVAIYGGE